MHIWMFINNEVIIRLVKTANLHWVENFTPDSIML